ncbi:M16 family metallopeptidase [Novosphingobium taihuense]|uniref:Zinc protease n=1 Tax=Novosphingobium taihuense TaxID=260085 RepID=A0A7W7EVK6_9SPHN|nr:M16 family metallopeptidase [Novosphingobium taihuense]MBB4613340.1 zinc protease [Novosphingobium taihuense]TWH85480.1 zinc protease [Novosphingobium taihuense]
MILRRLLPPAAALAAALALTACASQPASLTSAPKPTWAFQQSDLPPDPAYRYGQLPNGMRFIIRKNATPAGTAQVRMDVATGSLDERESERGFAHFVEHMAFNGSTNVPEGEMIKLLERNGLSFGADTNAQTSFEQTLYMLDLPRNDAKLLDTALMLMRETASELKFDPQAVARERGVVLSELRDGQGWSRTNLEDQLAFFYPAATYPKRLPIGTVEALNAATADTLKAFWAREYVPSKTTLIVVGDFEPDAVEQAIRARFADWQPRPETPRPAEGKVDPKQKAKVDIHLDPSLSERVTASRHGPWADEPDTIANRRRNLLRQIGYGVVNRRLARLSRAIDPPFRGAGFGTSEVFKIGRTTNLIVDTVDGGWQRGFAAAAGVYARALTTGFTQPEIDEQLANIRTGLENAAAGADTRPHGALVGAALALIRDDQVPTTPESGLARFNQFAPTITPATVMAALLEEAVPLKDPLIRFQGRNAPKGGAEALRKTWVKATRAKAPAGEVPAPIPFAYTDFGPAGTVVSDIVEPLYRIRQVRFANNVRLNLKYTSLAKDRIDVRLNIDGGEMLDTRADPLATEMTGVLARGGLGKHSEDDLQTLLAGRSVAFGLGTSGDTFSTDAVTTPRDLALQLQLMTALLTDPGYRPEGEVLYRQNIANFFARLRSSPGAALANSIGGILSDNDPRFTLQDESAYTALTFATLRDRLADRLAHGAIEISIVGDIDEAAAIAMVARTLGALPPREPDFRPYPDQRQRRFTDQRGLRIVRHTGEANQAIVRYTWPTRDDSDLDDAMALTLLAEVAGIEVLDSVREKLGKAYSPGASSALSRVWTGYGTFTMNASVDLADVPATRAALEETARSLIAAPIDADILQRARAPLLERMANALKTNGGWSSLAERAQTQPDRLVRAKAARARLEKLTPADLQAVARRYLSPEKAVQVLVVPEGAAVP